VSLSLWSFQWSNGHPSKFMFEVHFFSGAYITHWLKRFTFHFYSYLKLPFNRPLPRFDSIFYNNAPVLKRNFACPCLKNDFPSFLSSLYVRTTIIYWRNSSLFSTTHSTFLHSCPFRRSTEHILFRAIFLVGKIFGTFLAWNEGKSFLRQGQAKFLFKTGALL
jgi:hypothetical protein